MAYQHASSVMLSTRAPWLPGARSPLWLPVPASLLHPTVQSFLPVSPLLHLMTQPFLPEPALHASLRSSQLVRRGASKDELVAAHTARLSQPQRGGGGLERKPTPLSQAQRDKVLAKAAAKDVAQMTKQAASTARTGTRNRHRTPIPRMPRAK